MKVGWGLFFVCGGFLHDEAYLFEQAVTESEFQHGI